MLSKYLKVFGGGEGNPRLWGKPKSECWIEQELKELAGWVVYGSAKPAQGKLVGYRRCHTKVMLRLAALNHQSRLERALSMGPFMPIPVEWWLGTKEWGACVAHPGPGAAAVWLASAHSSGTILENQQILLQTDLVFIRSLYILQLVYFKFSLLKMVIANIDPVLSMYKAQF